MDEAKLLNVGKALVDMLTKINEGKVEGTSLAENIAYFQWGEQIYRMHLSKIEEHWLYSLADKDATIIELVTKEDEGEKVDGRQVQENSSGISSEEQGGG